MQFLEGNWGTAYNPSKRILHSPSKEASHNPSKGGDVAPLREPPSFPDTLKVTVKNAAVLIS